MNNFFIKSFFFILLNIGIVLKSENIEFILTSSDTLKGFEFMKIEKDKIILESSFSNYILNIKDLSSIDRLSSKIIKPHKKNIIYNSATGLVLGNFMGNLMGNVLIWWIKNEELGTLNLFESKPNDLNRGEKFIKSTAVNLMTSLGFYAGYKINNQKLILRKKYELIDMTVDQKTNIINKIFALTEKEKLSLIKNLKNRKRKK